MWGFRHLTARITNQKSAHLSPTECPTHPRFSNSFQEILPIGKTIFFEKT